MGRRGGAGGLVENLLKICIFPQNILFDINIVYNILSISIFVKILLSISISIFLFCGLEGGGGGGIPVTRVSDLISGGGFI